MPQLNYSPTFAERYPIAFIAGVTDFLLIVAGSYVAHWLRFNDWFMLDHYLVATLVIALVIVICQFALGTYLSWRGRHLWAQLGRMFVGWLLALAVVASIAVLLKVAENYSRIWLISTLAVALAFVTVFRVSVHVFLRQLRIHGRNLKQVLVVELQNAAAPVRAMLDELPEHGFAITCFLPLGNDDAWYDTLRQKVVATAVHEVWLCLPLNQGEAIKQVMYALRHQTVDVRYIPDLGDLPLLNHRISHIGGLYTLDISRSPMEGPARVIKRLEDLILGAIISVLMLPVCAVIAVAIKLTSKGPVIFKQYRMGINGRRFKVYKFRSMEVHEEESGQVTQARFGDPRITKLGAFLRRTSLDELPQFYNVLQGRMSIVGPRPHALAHNEYYKDLVESYMQRHKVKPGITGWAQVNGLRGETDTLEKMERRVQYDLWYIDNWSLWLDLKIIALTVWKGFINEQP
ncbi:undecaprenyl-phosphate glucose phosphotransferase [Yanghanlia caeni]|uniref:Undecaprenyl-phosphate glucose phosphotransferase n=1 Tax=Yanghanlia caeni TaxID=3064283 RepID=A0ABU1D515_9BURK|nr:undecaprenyl-phosphate glucose phosphotransferase [Alcaligenaceae bacterium LG-2]